MQQTSTPCDTCPWLKTSDRHSWFPPQSLKRTVVDYLDREQLHPCHSRNQTFCPGYLAFVRDRHEGGIISLAMGRLAIFLKLLDLDRIPELDTFESIEQMLADHQDRSQSERTQDLA